MNEAISNPKYKERLLALKVEMATFNPIAILVENIEELAGSKNQGSPCLNTYNKMFILEFLGVNFAISCFNLNLLLYLS